MLTRATDVAPGTAGMLPAGATTSETTSDLKHSSTAARSAVRRSDAGPLLLFTLFALFFLLPFTSDRIVLSPASDLNAHLSGIQEARNALLEGQFPVRVAPRQVDGQRYPLLQFYGNFPYTAGAVLTLVFGANPYTAWKIVTVVTVALAGFYTYKCVLSLTRQVWPAVVAGTVFVLAPYLTTDIRARFAYPESVSFCLLPALMYYSWRAFASRRRSIRAIVLGGVCWCLVAQSHNVTYLYGSLLLGLFFLTCVTFRPSKDVPRLLRVGACYALGLALALWYICAQLQVLKYITIAQTMGSPLNYAPLEVLLSPTLIISPKAVGTPNFGLQVGWPILAAVVLAAFYTARGAFRRSFQGAMLARLLAAFLLAFFLVWSPVDFWRVIPQVFSNVQFTYRVLMFVVLWGSLLSGVALAVLQRRRGGMGRNLAWAMIFLVALAAVPYAVWRHAKFESSALKAVIKNPDLGSQAALAYRPMLERIRSLRSDTPVDVSVVPAMDLRDAVTVGRITTYTATPTRPFIAQLPVLFYPDLLDVRVNGQPLPYGHLDGLLAVRLAAGQGPQIVSAEFVGATWANLVSLAAWLGVVAFAAASVVNGWKRKKAESEAGAAALAAGGTLRAPGPAVFPFRAAGFAMVLIALPLSLTAAYTPIRRSVYQRGVGRVWASSESDPQLLQVSYAFDNDPDTAWAASGSKGAVLRIIPPAAKRVAGIELEPRRTILLEAWHRIDVVLSLGGKTVAEQSFTLPDAATQPAQELKLDAPIVADKIELRFSVPVTLTLDGKQHIDPGLVNPGYREIRVQSD